MYLLLHLSHKYLFQLFLRILFFFKDNPSFIYWVDPIATIFTNANEIAFSIDMKKLRS